MTHFLGAGTIASDIVRKETRNGVLATFRLRSGAKGRGQVWIDVEAWGHLAGTVHQHGHPNRPVIVAGRLTQKTWHHRATGEARHRYVITANDIDLLPHGDEIELANAVVAFGTIDTTPSTRPAGTGTVIEFRLATGRAGSKTGRLWIDVEHWHRQPLAIRRRGNVALAGHLVWRRSSDGSCYVIDADGLDARVPRSARSAEEVDRGSNLASDPLRSHRRDRRPPVAPPTVGEDKTRLRSSD